MNKKVNSFILITLCIMVFAISCLSFGCKKSEPEEKQWSDDFDLFASVLEYVKSNYITDIDLDKIDYNIACTLINSLDPFSYITDNAISVTSEAGIGINIKVSEYNEYIVTNVFDNMPAAQEIDGFTLSRGDYIYAINGIRVEGLDSSYFSMYTAGGEGTSLILTVKRAGAIVGDYAYVKTAAYMPRAYYVADVFEDSSDIGYIKLSSFSETKLTNGQVKSVADDFDACMRSFTEDGMNALILDLRGNPGGSSSILSHIASYFVPSDENASRDILCLEYARTKEKINVAVTENNYVDKPLILLTDSNTASAAEALVGACRAFNGDNTYVIGAPTYGKGVFQAQAHKFSDHTDTSELTFDDTYYLVLVSGYYYILDPSVEEGRYNIHNNPIIPDLKVNATEITASVANDAELIASKTKILQLLSLQ